MDFTIKTLGACKIKSPLKLSKVKGDGIYDYVEDGARVLYSSSLAEVQNAIKNNLPLDSFEKPPISSASERCSGRCRWRASCTRCRPSRILRGPSGHARCSCLPAHRR